MNLSYSYQNRTVDIAITDVYRGKQTLAFSNKIVTGMQKLVQQVIIKFFTAFNSKLLDPQEGTTMGTNLGWLQNFNQNYTKSFVALTLHEILVQLQIEPSTNNDENIKSIDLNSLTFDKTTMNLSVNVVNQLNQSYSFIIPIALPIR